MSIGKRDAKKARYWQQTVGQAARSGLSIREFCRRRRLKESQFYWWQHRLKMCGPERTMFKPGLKGEPASFALLSDEAVMSEAGIELILGNGRRLHIRNGVDEGTLRAVLAALEPRGC